MSYAIIETGGKQMRVEVGRFYEIELLDAEPDTKVTIDKVLFVNNDGEISVGAPYIEGATVEGTVLQTYRSKKVLVYKMQPKKKTRKKRGHRQNYMRFNIDSITVGGKTLAAAETPVTA
ncbi:MAG: 50S ribosomal protein L21 [Oscillatoriales cyanobacterium]|jgi:large subunit ribosomal protein L21|nr:MAG: 50S ribosomal protein L21 [Oscillatoriales cyanobacterium]